MTEFSQKIKSEAIQKLVQNWKHNSMFNCSGYKVEFVSMPDCRRSCPSESFHSKFLDWKELCSYFVYDEPLAPSDMRAMPQQPKIPYRDTTQDCEMRYPTRVLFVPVEYQDSPDEKSPPMVMVFVSEAHGMYIQQHRRWLPANVVIAFPINYRIEGDGPGVIMRVHSIGFITSPHTSLTKCANTDPYMCPLFFGIEANYEVLLRGKMVDTNVVVEQHQRISFWDPPLPEPEEADDNVLIEPNTPEINETTRVQKRRRESGSENEEFI